MLAFLAGCQQFPTREDEPKPESNQRPAWSEFKNVGPTAYFSTYQLQSGDLLEATYQINVVEVPRYTLNVNDVVELKFFDLPEQSLEQVIRPDGRITAPLLGDVRVVGLTPEQAMNKLREAYVGTLKDPNVYLVVKDFSKRVEELRNALSNPDGGQSRDIPIQPDGAAVFPIIGAVSVGGMTLASAQENISRQYRKRYSELQVQLGLKQTANQFIYVLGEVGKPGAYDIKRPLSIGQVLALAGGMTVDARLDEIVLVRRIGAETVARKINYGRELQGNLYSAPTSTVEQHPHYGAVDRAPSRLASTASVFLQPDDILYVPKRSLASAAQISTEIASALMFRGFSIDLYDLFFSN